MNPPEPRNSITLDIVSFPGIMGHGGMDPGKTHYREYHEPLGLYLQSYSKNPLSINCGLQESAINLGKVGLGDLLLNSLPRWPSTNFCLNDNL